MRTRVLGSGESCDALAPWESVSCDCLASSDAPCPRDEGQSRDTAWPTTEGPSPATRRVPGTGPPSPETASQDGALSGDPRCPRDPRWSGEGGCHSLMGGSFVPWAQHLYACTQSPSGLSSVPQVCA